MRKLLLAALLPLILGSCATFKYTHLAGSEEKKVPAESVNVYPRYSKIQAQVKDIQPIGMIKYNCGKEKKVWKHSRKIAGAHGANSVYLDLYKGKHDEFKGKGIIYTFNK